MTFNFVEKVMCIGGNKDTESTFQFYKKGFVLGGNSGSTPSWQDIILSGNTALTLVNAKANGLNYVKLFGACEQRNLPTEYTQVNYISNTASTQNTVVNTGIMLDFNNNYEFEIECKAVGGPWYLFQSREVSSSPSTGITGSSTGNTIILNIDGSRVCTSAITRTEGNILYLKATLNNGTATLYVKDKTAGVENTQTNTYTTTSNPTTAMCLFGNLAGQIVSAGSNIYMARIKENGIAIMDYVPCKQNNTIGFYDKPTETLKTASNLIAGADTTPSPDTPVDIVSNNGVLKARVNLVNTANSTKGQYISSQGFFRSSANWATSDYLPVIAGGKVTVSGLTYASSAAGFNYYDASKNKVSTIPYETGTHTYTVPNNASYIMIAYRWEEDESTVKVYLGETLNAPYADGTVETINAHGKNLAIVSQSSAGLGYVKIPSSLLNKTVTLSSNSTDFLLYAIGNSAYQPVWTSGTLIATFTVTQEMIDTVGLWVRKNSTYGAMTADELNSINLQLELGSTATDYEPYYDGDTATAEMLLSVDDYKDEQEVLTGAVTRNVGVKVLDGSETVVKSVSTTAPLGYYFGVINTNKPHIVDSNGYCSHFTNTRNSSAALSDNTFAFGSSRRIWFATSKFTEVSDFQQYLADQYNAGQPVTVVYPLAEPTTETVTGQALTTQAGTNIVEITQASIDNLALEVSYKGKQTTPTVNPNMITSIVDSTVSFAPSINAGDTITISWDYDSSYSDFYFEVTGDEAFSVDQSTAELKTTNIGSDVRAYITLQIEDFWGDANFNQLIGFDQIGKNRLKIEMSDTPTAYVE